MKTVLLCGTIVTTCLLTTPAVLTARDVGKSPPPKKHIFEMPSDIGSRPPTRLEGLFATSPVDTYVVAEFSFENEFLECDRQGWISVDRTIQLDTFFHVDDFAGLNGGDFGRLTPLEGEKSLWCGARPSGDSPYCHWLNLPGYGNSWEQFFESVEFSVVGDAIVSYKVRWDTEPSRDFAYAEYWDEDYWRHWRQLPVNGGLGYYDGAGELTESLVVDSAAVGGALRLRFRVETGWSGSDEDGLRNSDGLIVIDSLTIMDATGTIDYQDFETESVGATATNDGDWSATVTPGFGDYSGLFNGGNVLQEDPCKFKRSCLWGFFDGSNTTYGCGGHPEQPAIPFGPDENGYYLQNEIWSPPIQWSTDVNGNPIPGTATRARLEFDVYRDLALDALIFYVWHIRSIVDGCAGTWEDYDFFYYGGQKDWLHVSFEAGAFVEPGASHVQIALGCYDMCEYWCMLWGREGCPSHAPLIDNVRLLRIDERGPTWSIRHFDLFQDNFAEDGTITGPARADMAIDALPNFNPSILPGDSAVVQVSDPDNGLAIDPITGLGPAVYAYVSVWPQGQVAKSGPNIEAPETRSIGERFPLVDSLMYAGAAWYCFRMDSVFTSAGALVDQRFCFDLNDSTFTPGDTICYFFGAENTIGERSYWSRRLDGQGSNFTTEDITEALESPLEFTILPAGGYLRGGDILYVDDSDDRGGPVQLYFDTAFDILGIRDKVDRYDVLGPASAVGNGLASRVKDVPAQLIDCYRKVIWCSGDLRSGTIGDGGPPNGGSSPEKSDDFGLLYQFLDQRTQTVGVCISGDNIAQEWSTLTGAAAIAMKNTFMNFTFVSGNHRNQGIPISPRLVAEPGSAFDDPISGPDTLIAYGGCPVINDFDVLQPTGAAVTEFGYPTGGGSAVISQVVEHPQSGDQDARVILSGFSYHFVRDDRSGQPVDRVDHLRDILLWMDNAIPEPTGIDHTPKLANYLDNNYPNPFNPVTTIRYGIRERGHVSLKIYNVAGQLVKTLIDEEQTPRTEGFKAIWDGTNNGGEPVSSGVYFYKLATRGFNQTKKMVLLK